MLALLPFCFVLCVATGEISLSIADITRAVFMQPITDPTASVILYEFRIPEAFTAIICSAALAVSGLIMQSYFRNPLAGPSVMGVSSGASFGIVLLLVCFPSLMNGSFGSKAMLILFASAGALAVLVVLSLIQFRLKSLEILLIVGLLIGYFLSSCETMLLSGTDAQKIKSFVHWGFGSFAKTNYTDLLVILAIILPLLLLSLFMTRVLDAFQFSDDTIANTGISKQKSGYILILLSGMICALVTAYCGPIAFIGLCVPHITRMYLKTSRHFYLITGSVLMAACIGLVCVSLSRLTLFGQQLPINSVTSFLGAPFILYLLLSGRQKRA